MTTSEGLVSFVAARFHITATATTRIELPLYKGSSFHGGFGHALKKIAPPFYQYFYEPPAGANAPKPYVLLPPLEDRLEYLPGESLQFQLTLFGAAVQHFPICFAAFDALGQPMGIGKTRGRYLIERVEYANADNTWQSLYQDRAWSIAQTAVTGAAIADASRLERTDQITLTLQTRLRLKDNDRLVRDPPPFRLLLDRLLGRLHTLTSFYQEGELLNRVQRNPLLDAAEAIEIEHAELHWDDWSRYSGRQKEWMKFGGLLGSITYRGDLSPFMPYLALGEWVHLGGKTSFGLGKYEISH